MIVRFERLAAGGSAASSLAVVISLALVLGGCSGGTRRPRTRDDITRDKLSVETLYLTDDGQRVLAPKNPQGFVVVDLAARKFAWPAWECMNPDCPGKQADGSRFLFPWPMTFLEIGPDGKLLPPNPNAPDYQKKFEQSAEQKCPACLPRRNLAAESPKQRQQYQSWCVPHVTPRAAARLAELERETQAILARQPAAP